VNAVILSIGTELVRGLRLDTHAVDLARAATAIGAGVVRHETLDDDAGAIAAAFRRAAAEADVLIATGGLGPTRDDCTRHGLAEAMGAALVEHPDAVAHLEAWAETRGRLISPSNRVQTLLPEGAEALPNPVGTAVGIAARLGEAQVYCLPGVPAEMRAMLRDSVLPRLREASPGRVARVRTLRTFGLPESEVGERLADLMAAGRPTRLGTACHAGVIDVHLHASGPPEEVDRLLDADAAVVRERLGGAVFAEGEQTMEAALADLLREAGVTVALAESCTGGLVAAKLVSVPGMSDHLLEAVVAYANASKVRTLGVPESLIAAHGAVSEPVVRAMAEGARDRAGACLALAVTGIAGPGGGTPEKCVGTVWFALADAEGTRAVQERLPGDRALVRERAALYGLNLLRLRLSGRLNIRSPGGRGAG